MIIDPTQTSYDVNPEDPLPHWAIRTSEGNYLEVGAQLRTKDGRCCGNAFVTELVPYSDGLMEFLGEEGFTAGIRTDAGSDMRLTRVEMEEHFHPPQFIVDVEEAKLKFPRMCDREVSIEDMKKRERETEEKACVSTLPDGDRIPSGFIS